MNLIILFKCFFIFTFYTQKTFTEVIFNDAPIVSTKYGLISGVDDTLAYAYLGIPFATPPLNNLRWNAPIESPPWSPQILNATNFKPSCPQIDCSVHVPSDRCPTKLSEDCLYLNVFVPKTETISKAVMIFIHGGNYLYEGTILPEFNGKFLANMSDVIVVTITYRLGAFGFLVTGLEPDQLKGNYAIMDQKLAIKWVYENIQAFGGDPERITIFGQSAGAQSVSIHLLSSDMQSYFTNAIIQSGPFSIPFRTYDEAMTICTYFTKALNCSIRDVQCLRNKTIDEILKAQTSAGNSLNSFEFLLYGEPWVPFIDGKLIKGQLLELDKWTAESNFTVKPFIIGTLTEECYIYVYSILKNSMNSAIYTAAIIALFKQEGIKVLDHYPPKQTSDQRDLTSQVTTIWVFSCSSRLFLENAIKANMNKNTYYMYVFDYALDFDGWDQFQFCNNHTCHGTDLAYTFDVLSANFTSDGRLLATQHVNYWTNFAKYGTVNTQNKNNSIYWPQYDIQNRTFLRFKKFPFSIENNYLTTDCDFFDSIGYYH